MYLTFYSAANWVLSVPPKCELAKLKRRSDSRFKKVKSTIFVINTLLKL
jgi:hypothetical protein